MTGGCSESPAFWGRGEDLIDIEHDKNIVDVRCEVF